MASWWMQQQQMLQSQPQVANTYANTNRHTGAYADDAVSEGGSTTYADTGRRGYANNAVSESGANANTYANTGRTCRQCRERIERGNTGAYANTSGNTGANANTHANTVPHNRAVYLQQDVRLRDTNNLSEDFVVLTFWGDGTRRF